MERVPVVSWGGTFFDDDGYVRLSNTCSIDTTLQVLLALNKTIPGMKTFWEEKRNFGSVNSGIAAAANFLEAGNFNAAKTTWIRDVMGKDPWKMERKGDMRNSEFESGLQFVTSLFPVKKIHRCSQEDCPGYSDPSIYAEVNSRKWHWENSTLATVRLNTPARFEETITYGSEYDAKCYCGSQRVIFHEFDFENPPFLVYALLHDDNFSFDERYMPLTQTLAGKRFRVFAYTTVSGSLSPEEDESQGIPHFLTTFVVDKKKIVYDGLQLRPYIQQKSPKNKVTSIWLVPG